MHRVETSRTKFIDLVRWSRASLALPSLPWQRPTHRAPANGATKALHSLFDPNNRFLCYFLCSIPSFALHCTKCPRGKPRGRVCLHPAIPRGDEPIEPPNLKLELQGNNAQQYRPPSHFTPYLFLVSTTPTEFPFPVFSSVQCMYNHLLLRRRDAVNACVQLLRDHSREMALDSRFFRHIGQSTGPGSISSATSSESSAMTGITSPSVVSTSASAATFVSTASSPSLRARESVPVPVNQDGAASPSPGGNVRVVVRVRKFLPRGTCRGSCGRGIGSASNVLSQRSNATQNVLSRWTHTLK